MCSYTLEFRIHLSTSEHWCCVYILAIVSNPSVSHDADILSWSDFISAGVYESWSSSNFNDFWGGVFRNGGANCTLTHREQVAPCFTSVIFLIFSIIAVLTGMKWHLILVLICISLMLGDVQHLFNIHFSHFQIFFGEISVQIFAHF